MDSIVERLERTFDPEERRNIGAEGGSIAANRAKMAEKVIDALSSSKLRTSGGLRRVVGTVTFKNQRLKVTFVEQNGASHCKYHDHAVKPSERVKLAWGFIGGDYVIRVEYDGRKRSFRYLPDAHKHWIPSSQLKLFDKEVK